MRLLKLGVYYSAYLQQFYQQHPTLASQRFHVQHNALIEDCFGSSDFWTTALSKLGYETGDIIANAEPMQKMWANEQGLPFDHSNWLFEIAAAQIQAFRPDVLLVADYSTITAEFLRHLRDSCPSIRLVLGWCGAPFQDGSIFRECDLVLSCVPELVASFQEDGHRSRHVNHAFELRIMEKIDVAARPSADFVFIGSIVKSAQFHIEREKLLLKLVNETDLEIWSEAGLQPGAGEQHGTRFGAAAGEDKGGRVPASRWPQQISAQPLLGPMARRASRFLFGGSAQFSTSSPVVDHQVQRRARPPLFGLRMFQQLHDSRVALNIHIDASPISASNMRMFEVTGVGACLLTDWKANLSGLFDPESEVVAYRCGDECVEKVKYLLEHESERRRIATNGQRRTFRDHTFDHRAAQIDAFIHEALTTR